MPKSEEQCRAMRDNMRNRIIREASLYFARNGFGDTKISDLARHIGIAQGTMYLYFKSKEELFEEIRKNAGTEDDLKKICLLIAMPVSAVKKAELLSKTVITSLKEDEDFAVRITLSTQLIMEQGIPVKDTQLYKETAKIIRQARKEGSAADGDVMMLADMYWGMVYLYSLKSLFGDKDTLPSAKQLMRLIINDQAMGRKGGAS